MNEQRGNRRRFLQQSTVLAATAATPYFFSAANVQADDAKAAAKNDRPIYGAIGCGGQGSAIANRARQFGDLVAVCDVDGNRAERARQRLSGGSATIFADYRKLLERKDIEAVTIGTPDHWHSKIAIEAMQAGKDVYCEKPLTLTVDEGKLICRAVEKTGRVFQVGTQQRSHGPFAQAIALCRAGRLGKIRKITVAIGGGPAGGPFKKQAPPNELNWDAWQGQTPAVDYIKERCHHDFRWWLEYSGGKMTDWGAHHVDIAHWALAADNTGPVSFSGSAQWPVALKDGYPTEDNRYNTATTFTVSARFQDGVELIITDRTSDFDNGVLIEGDKSRLFVNRGKLTGRPVEDLADNPLADDAISKVYKGRRHGNHMGNFFESIKSREQPISDVFSHHRAITTCHLANICLRLDRELKWDPEKQEIVGDEQARSFQSREQRKGYEIVV